MRANSVVVVLSLILGGCVSLQDTDYVDMTRPRPKPVYDEPVRNTYDAKVPAQSAVPKPLPKISLPKATVKVETKKESVKPAPPRVVEPIAKSSTLTATEVQQALLNAGYYDGKIDGKIGPRSQAAIKKFQADKGLKVDGVVGGKTSAALAEHLQTQTDSDASMTTYGGSDTSSVTTDVTTYTDYNDYDSLYQ